MFNKDSFNNTQFNTSRTFNSIFIAQTVRILRIAARYVAQTLRKLEKPNIFVVLKPSTHRSIDIIAITYRDVKVEASNYRNVTVRAI